jgi:hypothetical protein
MDTPVLTKCLALLLALSLPSLSHAGYKPGPGWPEVSTPYFRAETPAEAAARLASWRAQNLVIRGYRDTGSMRPVLKGGREVMAMERCTPDTPLEPGQMVEFNRGDLPAVLHYIADVSRDGKHLYISGVNNRRSDGWFHRDTVAYVVREIITTPDQQSAAIAQQIASATRQPQAVTVSDPDSQR